MRRSLEAALTVALLAVAAHAHADDAANREGRARFKEGVALADASNHEGARLKFLQAFAMLKAPAILFNLASMEQKTGHEVDAIEHYRAFLKGSESDAHTTDATREKAKKEIAELAKKVAQIEIDAPDGARLTVDGRPLEGTPSEPVAVAPGKRKVEATLAGKVRAVSVDAIVGEVVRANVAFDDAATAPSTPPAPSSTAPSRPASSLDPADDDGAERTTAGWAVPIALGVLGVGGLVAGAAFASASQSSKEESEALGTRGLCAPAAASSACAAYDARRSDAESQATLAYAGYIGGGILLGGAVTTFLLMGKTRKPSSATNAIVFTPVIGTHRVGGGVQLRF